VKRAEQDSTDVNLIMDSWIHAGAAVAGHMNPSAGRYGDFSSGLDYHAALSSVREAEGIFMCFAPKIRDHVDNDAGKFLDMVYDPERRSELEELGIVPPLAGAPPVAVVDPKDEVSGSGDPVEPAAESQVSADPAAGLFD